MKRHAGTQVATRSTVTVVTPLKRAGGPNSAEYRAWLAALLREKAHQASFKRALFRDTHPHFMSATKHAATTAFGLPVQPTVDLTPREPARLTAEQLLDALPRILTILPGGAQAKVKLLQEIRTNGELVK